MADNDEQEDSGEGKEEGEGEESSEGGDSEEAGEEEGGDDDEEDEEEEEEPEDPKPKLEEGEYKSHHPNRSGLAGCSGQVMLMARMAHVQVCNGPGDDVMC